MPKICLLLAALVLLGFVACHGDSNHVEPDYPTDPQYPMIAYEREFEMYGADTVWGGRVDYEYDSDGRYSTILRSEASGRQVQRMKFVYNGNEETLMVYGAQGQMLRKFVYTYLDDSYRREPAYEGPYYRGVTKCEEFDAQGTRLSLTNNCYDTHRRVAQTDGFDVESGTLYISNLYYPYGSDYTLVKNPKSANEETLSGKRTYADSTCHYELSHSKQLNSGNYVQQYTYDTLGRRITHIGSISNVLVDDIEYIYLDDREYEIDHLNNTQTIRYYLQ